MNIKSYLPILDWLPSYGKTQMQGDIAAGLTVGVMLIPQGMAYAMIAGLPPVYGLYASIIPLILYAILGTSRQLAVGPVAMVSLLTAAGVATIAEVGSDTYIALAITLALLVGVIQFLLGVFRLGFLVNFLSHPVISGFTSAAALIIGLSQLKHLLGIQIARTHHVHEIVLQAIQKFGEINWITFGLGVAGIGLIILAKKIHKSIPGPLVAVVFGILSVWGFGLSEQGVKIVGEIPSSLPSFQIPELGWESVAALLPIALAISLVSFMESIAVAKAIQAKHKKDYKVVPNQELIALGVANIGGALFQSYPVTGGFSRTAVNDQAGAKTGLAAIISAVLIVLTLLFLTPLFFYLPKAMLASVIMVAVFGLIDIKEPKHLWVADRSDFWMLVVTFVATLSLGIEQGIGVGVILSLAMIIFQTTRPHIAELGKVPGADVYRNVQRFKELEVRDDVLIIRFDAQLYFANITYFREKIEAFIEQKGKNLRLIILKADAINKVDSSALHAIEELVNDLRDNQIDIAFTGVKGPVRDDFAKSHLLDKIGSDHFFMTVDQAMDCYVEQCIRKGTKKDNKFNSFSLQTNV